MRAAIFDALFNRMAHDKDVFFLWADMGIGLVERFQAAYPDRTVNVGIAEQNLIGIGAGLANVGFKPVVYTCSQFYLRAFEQIRLECGLNGAPIVMLGTTVGYDNAALGPTHHVIDDWAALKAIPGIDIYCPSSITYAEALLDRALCEGRPAYIRIAKGSFREPISLLDVVHLYGYETVFVTSGPLVQECMKVREKTGAGVVILNQLHPLPRLSLGRYHRIIVVEDQVRQGLYASICEMQPNAKIEHVGPSGFDLVVGATDRSFWKRYGMDADSLIKLIERNPSRDLRLLRKAIEAG